MATYEYPTPENMPPEYQAVGVLRRPIQGSPTAPIGFTGATAGEGQVSYPPMRTLAQQAARSVAAAEAEYPTRRAVDVATPAYASAEDIARERASPFMSGRGVVAAGPTLPATGRVSREQGGYPILPGAGEEGRFSDYYGRGSTPMFPTAASMKNMVPQEVQDMIAAQTNRINFLRAGGGGLLGQAGAKYATDRLLAMQELANRFMGTGVQAGHLGVQQGELGVKRGQLDLAHGQLGLGYGQLGADIWKHQPLVDRETLLNQIAAPNGVPTARSLDLAGQFRRPVYEGKPRREISTVQGPYEITSGDTNVIFPEGRVTKTPLVPGILPGGAGDTKKPYGGAPIGTPYAYTPQPYMPDPYRPAVSSNVR